MSAIALRLEGFGALRAHPALPVSAAVLMLTEILGHGHDAEALRALQVFLLALVGWTLTRLDDAFVAVLAALGMSLLVLEEPEEMFEGLGDELIWRMLAAFILASAFRASGLADALAAFALGRARTVRGAFFAVTAVLLAGAFVVPSTSGRAALAVPVYELATEGADEATRKAFSLLFPTVILLSAVASLTGAGAHVLAAELVGQIGGGEIGFLTWALYGLPFAAACSFLASEVILRLFLPVPGRRAAFAPPAGALTPALRPEARLVLAVAALVLVGWLSKPLHDVDETVVALIGALAATAPQVGGADFRTAVKGVEWPLMLFMAATVVIAEGLTESGLIKAFAAGASSSFGTFDVPPLVWLIGLAAIGLFSHLVIHSRTARIAALLPPGLAAAQAAEVSPPATMLTLVAATGFCQLLMVSAKPIALFGATPGAFGQADLLRLGAALVPLQLALVALFAGVVWPVLGLEIAK